MACKGHHPASDPVQHLNLLLGLGTRPDRLGGAGPRSDIPGGLGGAIGLTPTGKLSSRGVFG